MNNMIHERHENPSAVSPLSSGETTGIYLETISLIERLHRHFLEVVKSELDRLDIRDLNSVQALILFNIGEEELTVGELTNRGYYLGSNVSYNVKKMVENGYLLQERSKHDRRSVRVRLSDRGLHVCQVLSDMYAKQIAHLKQGTFEEPELNSLNASLLKLDRFWSGVIDFGLRS
ncbi:MAG: winged helix DNA-binding protein [Pseudomonadota bacterium]